MTDKRNVSFFEWLVRLGLLMLVVVNVIHILFPSVLRSYSDSVLGPWIVDVVGHFPAFNEDWKSVLNLVSISMYIYVYLLTLMLTSILFGLRDKREGVNGDASVRWYALPGVVDIPREHGKKRLKMFLGFLMRRKTVGAVAIDVSIVLLTIWIMYAALQQSSPSTGDGELHRLIEVVVVGMLCYSVFSIAVWVAFYVSAFILQFESDKE